MQVRMQIENVISKFSLAPDQGFDVSSKALSDACWGTFASGVLLEHFRSAKDKASLRINVQKVLDLLTKNKCTSAVLPAILRARSNSALKFQVAV
jgi:hypothetical protein